jgi:excinuclease ABC subunit A
MVERDERGAWAGARAPLPEGSSGWVRVRGAREHNLREIDIDIPRDSFVVFTGVSGSGKSSLAFGTIYAEAQRRYFESVAPYARRLLDQVGAPDIDSIEGLPPAVALRQSRAGTSSRSSVGTITSLSNVLRMLFSRAGNYLDPDSPRLDSDAFSPNTVAGACPTCHGLGMARTTTEKLLVPDASRSIRDGAIAVWPGAWLSKNYREILVELGYDIDVPWHDLSRADRDWILFTDEEPNLVVHPVREPHKSPATYKGQWISVRKYLFTTYAKTQSESQQKRLEPFFIIGPCPACHGKRLRPEALAVTFEGHDIIELAGMSLDDTRRVLVAAVADRGRGAHERSGSQASVAAAVGRDLIARLDVVIGLGLGYLTMTRASTELSSGELQRLRLATQLRSGLFGVVYVLDEPSAGLHPADTESLYAALRQLLAAGNSLFVVEHDLAIARRADWIVDIGLGAGIGGGEIVYSGPPAGLAVVESSVTSSFMFPASDPHRHQSRSAHSWLKLAGLIRNNLQDISVEIPLGVMTAIIGVSGSGKTSLLQEILSLALPGNSGSPDSPDSREDTDAGADGVGVTQPNDSGEEVGFAPSRIISIDQKPIGRSPRSNLATYTGLFDGVRKLFADLPEAKARRYTASRFSFNMKGGRCETCQGEGSIEVELLFLPRDYSPCPTCHGRRYNPETLEIQYRGLSIADVLDLPVERAVEFFSGVPMVRRALDALMDVGLGYLTLGQPATELSGGEAQRIKLATELQRMLRGGTIFVLDEPTGGLHPANARDLIGVFRRLVDAGSTVIVVEHNMAVVAASDWVIELGPGGGDRGGLVMAVGSPTDLVHDPRSVSASYLANFLPPGDR